MSITTNINKISHFSQCLGKISGLINEPDLWTKDSHARLKDGSVTNWWDWNTVQFSLYGATRRCCNLEDDFSSVAGVIQEIIEELYGDYDIISINDKEAITHEDMLMILSEASRRIRGESINHIIITRTMKKQWEEDRKVIETLNDIEYAYFCGYHRGVKNKFEWEVLNDV